MTTNNKPAPEEQLPSWFYTRKSYWVIHITGEKSLVKLSKKREKVLKKCKCSHCRFSKAETGWTHKHLDDNHGGGVLEICPNCGRVSD